MKTQKADELIKHLHQYKLTIADLYEAFAFIFPASSKIWTLFANQERVHAKFIKALHAHGKSEEVSFKQTKVTSQAASLAIGYIKKMIDQTVTTNLDLEQALAIAIDIEKSLLRNAFYSGFELNDPRAERTRRLLIKDRQVHTARLLTWQSNIKSQALAA